jgi:hypothetical protein
MTSPHDPGPPRFSEAQLRDALRGSPTGDGSLDPGALIGRARSVRARRRGGVLAAGLVAAVIAVSVGVVTGDHGNGNGSSASQLERGDEAASGAGDTPKGSASGPSNPYYQAPSTAPAGPGSTTRYADRQPITGTPCPPVRPDPLAAPSGAGSTGPLLSFAPEQAWACVYLLDSSAVAAQLSAAQSAAAVALLGTGGALSADAACSSELGPSLRLIVTGSSQTATIDAQSYGCGVVTTGTASRQAKAQVLDLLAQLDDDLRPLG